MLKILITDKTSAAEATATLLNYSLQYTDSHKIDTQLAVNNTLFTIKSDNTGQVRKLEQTTRIALNDQPEAELIEEVVETTSLCSRL